MHNQTTIIVQWLLIYITRKCEYHNALLIIAVIDAVIDASVQCSTEHWMLTNLRELDIINSDSCQTDGS